MQTAFIDSTKLGEELDFTMFYGGSDVFSLEQVNRIKEIGDGLTSLSAQTFGSSSDDVRKGNVAWLSREAEDHKWIYDNLFTLAKTANDSLWKFDLIGFWEDCQYTTYKSDGSSKTGDHYDYHLDIDGSYGVQRKISIVVQLSDEDDYEGGELELRTSSNKFIANKGIGSVLLFPSFILHKVHPVTKGKRNSLVLWVSGTPFK